MRAGTWRAWVRGHQPIVTGFDPDLLASVPAPEPLAEQAKWRAVIRRLEDERAGARAFDLQHFIYNTTNLGAGGHDSLTQTIWGQIRTPTDCLGSERMCSPFGPGRAAAAPG